MKNADSLSFLMKVSGVQTLPSPGTCTTLMSPPRYFSLGSRHLCLGVSLVQSPMWRDVTSGWCQCWTPSPWCWPARGLSGTCWPPPGWRRSLWRRDCRQLRASGQDHSSLVSQALSSFLSPVYWRKNFLYMTQKTEWYLEYLNTLFESSSDLVWASDTRSWAEKRNIRTSSMSWISKLDWERMNPKHWVCSAAG